MKGIIFFSLLVVAVASSPPPQDSELTSHRMLDELLQLGADIKPLQAQVERIDEHLSKLDPNLSRESILEEIEEFRPELSDDLPLYQAANVLLRLRPDFTGGCDKASFNALAQAYLLIGGEPQELLQTESIVRRLVLEIAQDHKSRCSGEYAKLYTVALQRVDPQVVRDLEQLFNEEYLAKLHTQDIEGASLRHLQSDVGRLVGDLASKIKQNSGGLRNLVGNVLNGKLKDAEFHREQLISRCRPFSNYLGSVFAPARFDSMLFDGRASDLCANMRPKFCQHWRIYRICLAHSEENRSGALMRSLRGAIKNL